MTALDDDLEFDDGMDGETCEECGKLTEYREEINLTLHEPYYDLYFCRAGCLLEWVKSHLKLRP